jgi:uncharacterized protein YdaU (DUF1376 family)
MASDQYQEWFEKNLKSCFSGRNETGEVNMAKDPAVLFYTADFLVGTMTMSDEQVGKYIRLLCFQHQHLRMTDEDMLNICKSYDKQVYAKFIKDENGLYYNERMEKEINARKAYSESRSKNRNAKKNDICGTHDNHMSDICQSYVKHMVDVNEDVIAIDKENGITNTDDTINCTVLPSNKSAKEEKHKHGEYTNVLLTDSELDKLKSEYPDWQARIERLSSYIASKGNQYKSHYATIRNWARKDAEKNGSGSGKSETAEELTAKYGDRYGRIV